MSRVKRDEAGTSPRRRRHHHVQTWQGNFPIFLDRHSEVRRGGKLFWRNTWTSAIAFGIDIALLWVLVQFTGMAQIVAASIGFLVGVTIHYGLSRKYVFPHSEREVARGYAYFLINGGVGLAVTIGLFWILTALLPQVHYLILRGVASIAAGLVVFLLNAVFNFKALGKGSRETK